MKKFKFMTVFAPMVALMVLIAVQGFTAPPGGNSTVKSSLLLNAQHLAVAWDIGADKPIYQFQYAESVQSQILAKEEDTGPVAINVNAITVDRNAALTYSADVTALKKQKTKANVSGGDYRPTIVASVSNSNTRHKIHNIKMINTAAATS